MNIFFCSIRTLKIYGPVQISAINNPNTNVVVFEAPWPSEALPEEWEGYMVCVPSEKKVWGSCRPEYSTGKIEVTMNFTPQAMTPDLQKMFQSIESDLINS